MALALLGLGTSIYLTNHFYEVRSGMSGFKSLCNIGQKMNCDAVAASSYAEAFLGIPLSSFATGWYLALFAVYLFALGTSWRREAIRLSIAMTGFALVMSLAYLYVMVVVLQTYCLFCLVVDGVNLVSFGVALSLKPKGFLTAPIDRSQWKGLLASVAVSLFVGVVALKGLDQSNYKSSDLQWMVQEIMSQPPLPVGSDGRFLSLGPKDAPVTIVEFSDFQCPYCRVGATTMNTLLNRYPRELRVIFRNYPLDMSCNPQMKQPLHAASCEAARAAYCANQQGKFKALYEDMFENQVSLAPGKPEEMAKNVGIDEAKFQACLKAQETQLAIQADIEEGTRLGVSSTPTFFINGRKVEGVRPIPVWSQIIDQLAR